MTHELVDTGQSLAEVRSRVSTEVRRSTTLTHGRGVRVVAMGLGAGAALEAHATSAPTTIHVMEGLVRFIVDGEVIDAPAGRLLVLGAGVRHEVEAVSDSTILLTILASTD